MTDNEKLELELRERAIGSAAYWLDCSPHERTEEDGLWLARYARAAIERIVELETALKAEGIAASKEPGMLTREQIKKINRLLNELDVLDALLAAPCVLPIWQVEVQATVKIGGGEHEQFIDSSSRSSPLHSLMEGMRSGIVANIKDSLQVDRCRVLGELTDLGVEVDDGR